MKSLQQALLAACVLATAVLSSLSQANAQYAREIPYRVVGVAYNDVLNMRAGPGTKHPVIGALGPNASGIYILRCSNYINWCQVEGAGGRGWVNMRFLAGYAN